MSTSLSWGVVPWHDLLSHAERALQDLSSGLGLSTPRERARSMMQSPRESMDRIEYVLGMFDNMNSQEIGVFSRGIKYRDRSTPNESLSGGYPI